jgi:uncharacterized membrane protein required for colicin V production
MPSAALRVSFIRSVTGIGKYAIRFFGAPQRYRHLLPLGFEIVDSSDSSEVSAAIIVLTYATSIYFFFLRFIVTISVVLSFIGLFLNHPAPLRRHVPDDCMDVC